MNSIGLRARLRPAALALALLAAAPLSALAAEAPLSAETLPERPPSGPHITHATLANGMEIVVIPDHRAPIVTHMVWYRVGSADEELGRSGLAHFLEHLMFKGTAKHPEGEFSRTVSQFGGQENAFTTADYTGYFQRVPREHLGRMMSFEADRMTGLELTDAVVIPERGVVLEEQNMRVANSPAARLGEQIDAALFLNHPYQHPVIGWRHEIEKLNREDALAFYRRHYAPNNAILVVAGDVEADEVRRLAEDTYGKVAANPAIGPRNRPQEPVPIAARTVTFGDPRVEQPSLQRQYLVPSATTAAPGESEALDVLAHILGSGANSRLYKALVMDRQLAVNASVSYQETALDAGRFGIYASLRDGVDFPTLEAAIDALLADVADKGVTAAEVERAQTRMIASAVYAQDSQSTMARWYGAALATGQTVEAVQAWPQRIRAVTADAVQAAARRWLDKRRSVTGYLVKAPAPNGGRS